MSSFPSPPDIQSPAPWHLTDGASLDFSFDVIGTPRWSRPEEARWAQSPCGGPLTLLTVGDGTLQPRQFRVQVRLPYGPNRNTRLATLETLWAARGPYTLTAPVFVAPMAVLCDPSQGALEWEADGAGGRVAIVGFREVL